MTMRMLIDARHREETRVAVVKGSRIEEFDFESAEHKQLKGNIYLAKVTRVEPSLQAAFVDYGGNRHGFLAFSEIHPDYYQIPKEDRQALLAEEAEHAAEEARLRASELDEAEGEVEEVDGNGEASEQEAEDEAPPQPEEAESASEENAAESLRKKRQALRRRYKIQDVIRRRQVLLVQVVKEERGNKGAALTTYMSLAGRYCVLMPNTSHGGGISRKISNGADRKRLKQIMSDLSLPPSMGCIVRTAGLSRTKTEIKRDFDYLARLWDEIREKTLKSSAPALIYEDSDLVKRAIRDIYHREIEEVIVEGEEGYRSARAFMKLLMPSHVRRVKQYDNPVPLFQHYGVEDQLAGMYQPIVQLRSGGYLVINPTEALVSIDINSGRSTREHNIEQTAYATNIEAAHEIARQLRLRDMAGLVVIDFIDMESNGHVRKVERAMKEALKNDRARIQVGRISSFGLMEMSRQRLRTGVLEASTKRCPHCEGTGLVRTAASAGLSALRMLEEEAARGRGTHLLLRAGREAAVYVLNKKRHEIFAIEQRYGVTVEVLIEEGFEGAQMTVESVGPRPAARPQPEAAPRQAVDEEELAEAEDEAEEPQPMSEGESEDAEREGDRGRRRRRRRGRRGSRRPGQEDGQDGGPSDEPEAGEMVETPAAEGEREAEPIMAEGEREAEPIMAEGDAGGDQQPRTRRRRSRSRRTDQAERAQAAIAPTGSEAAPAEPGPVEGPSPEEPPAAKPRRSRGRKEEAAPEVTAGNEAEAPTPAAANDSEEATPPAPADAPESPVLRREAGEAAGAMTAGSAGEGSEPPRRGWWQRTFGG